MELTEFVLSVRPCIIQMVTPTLTPFPINKFVQVLMDMTIPVMSVSVDTEKTVECVRKFQMA